MNRMTLRAPALAALLGASLAGCGSLAPSLQRPPAPVPAAWPQPAAAQGPAADALAWQAFFTHPQLQALQATALRNNRDLRLALLNVEQLAAQAGVRRADRFPTATAGIAGSRTPSDSGGISSTYTAGLQVAAWELDLFGRLASLSDAAAAQVLAGDEARKAAQASLMAGVATTWLALLAGEEQLALTRQTLASREESLRLVRLRFDNGASSELDLRQAESLAESARVALAQQTRQRALDFNALSLLLGEPAPAEVGQRMTLADVSLPDLPAGVPAEVLARRPDVRQAEQQLVAANASIGAARAAFFPRITLTAGVGRASSALSDLFAGGHWGFTVAPQALLTVFDAGRNRASLRGAEVGRDQAVAQYERAIQSAFREVADALAGRASLGGQLEAQQRLAQAESARLRLSTLRYDNGVASALDLLDAQRSAFSARQAEIQARAAVLQNQVQLFRALGGGWVDASAAR